MKKILIGLTVFGEHYLNTFLQYTLPSLMTAGNLLSLAKEREILFQIHTDIDGAERLKNTIPYYVNFDLDIMQGDKYLLIGHHQNEDLALAKRIGADYHLLMPDFIYSENCFAGVLKCGHKAIIRTVVSTVHEDMVPHLKPNMSAIELATLSFQHIHPGIRNWLITPKGYPRTHVVTWVGKDTLTMCSPHQTLVYAANEVIHPVNSELPIDCILDQVIIGDIYCPNPEDGIVIVEMSPRESRRPQYDCVSIEEFCRIMAWDTNNSTRQFSIWDLETVDAIDRKLLGGNNYWNEVDISSQKAIINSALLKNLEN